LVLLAGGGLLAVELSPQKEAVLLALAVGLLERLEAPLEVVHRFLGRTYLLLALEKQFLLQRLSGSRVLSCPFL
jgi:hypothetical protein